MLLAITMLLSPANHAPLPRPLAVAAPLVVPRLSMTASVAVVVKIGTPYLEERRFDITPQDVSRPVPASQTAKPLPPPRRDG
ncbi:MAG: hypothetical protein JO250_15445 [Armatimonadetes bacterium]|nr:hypothetical protein [Armatimonadota bacterium]